MSLLLERYVEWLTTPGFMGEMWLGARCVSLHPKENEFRFFCPSFGAGALPWQVSGETITVTLPKMDSYYFGVSKRLSVLESRLRLIDEGKSVADDPYILILNQILDEAEQRRYADRLDYLSWMEGEIETRIVRPGWECAGLHSSYQAQIGREVCRQLGFDPNTQSGRGLSFWFESIDKDIPVEYLICEDHDV